MRISQLAERGGVPTTTLRFYEGEGLLPADRPPPATGCDRGSPPSWPRRRPVPPNWPRSPSREAVDGAVRAPVPEGLRLTLPVDRTARVAGPAAAEQRCCPFLGFRLHLDGPYPHVEVLAPVDSGALLTDLFGPAA
ncbi:MerR family DNA-binding transcriptional regulator [Streptomyces sp. NPDC096310]|uniref:MerR family DNA-binding transcriptional regulator n=1 Tax=Streptomyces sp. NPDC096310 TaxID=3366082 RepID=UPI00382F70C7